MSTPITTLYGNQKFKINSTLYEDLLSLAWPESVDSQFPLMKLNSSIIIRKEEELLSVCFAQSMHNFINLYCIHLLQAIFFFS